MNYSTILPGIFIERKNRFIATVLLQDVPTICHVKNTGRCAELFIPGVIVYVEKASNPNRKTQYDLIAVQKGNQLINVDSQIPNKVAAEWLQTNQYIPNLQLLKPETTFQKSRFDFYFETSSQKGFIEVKGVTLEQDGVALFPDAPTERGVKHINELIACHEQGYSALLIFIIQMKGVHLFKPNYITHPAFGEALQHARRKGVEILALDCIITPTSILADKEIPIQL